MLSRRNVDLGVRLRAATILKKIEDLGDKYHVPFTPPAGSTTRIDCSKPNAAQLVDNIKKLFEERLATMDAGGKRKQLGLIDKQIQGEIIDHAKKDQDDLKNIDNALVGVPYFVDSTLYHNVLTIRSARVTPTIRTRQEACGPSDKTHAAQPNADLIPIPTTSNTSAWRFICPD